MLSDSLKLNSTRRRTVGDHRPSVNTVVEPIGNVKVLLHLTSGSSGTTRQSQVEGAQAGEESELGSKKS